MMEIQSFIEFYDQRGRAFFATLQFTFSWGLLYGVLLFEQKLSRLSGIFGNCQDQSKANAENIRRLSDFQNSLTDYVTKIITHTEEKFFLVENELAALHAIQSEMAATQDKNCVIIQEQLAVYEQNFHILRDADQLYLLTSNLTLILIPFLLYFQ